MKLSNKVGKISVIGLGYVGLPLLIALSKKFNTVGFDIDAKRIFNLKKGIDETKEINLKNLNLLKTLNITSDIKYTKNSDIFIITVPTPVNKNNKPDLSLVKKASIDISTMIKKGSTVIYESTVYPGVTEEICAPIIEKKSLLKWKKDFFVGYSPERINPGDTKHTLDKIVKVVSGDTKNTLNKVAYIYNKVTSAGVYRCKSIKVAEAAKVIENTQRDLNIALVNELSIIFDRMGINTNEVLNTASTKWNFNHFLPGFVGGHCIGVDPYYLTYKSQQLKYTPKIILAGRKINDGMSKYVANKIIYFSKKKFKSKNLNVLILGFSFKENCPDIRNTKILDLAENMRKKINNIDIFDPIIKLDHVKKLKLNFLKKPPQKNYYDMIILAVPHDNFKKLGARRILKYGKNKSLFFDLKSVFDKKYSTWCL
jgi:UDP-N-acetyl-D-galactosamine dehydrogenase